MLESVTIAMEFDNVETVKRAIEINAGIAILPASTVVTESEEKTIGHLQTRRWYAQPSLLLFTKRTGC